MKNAVLITGATSGIGLEFAHILAGKGHDLVLVARDAQKLHEVSLALEAAYGVKVLSLQKDLSKQGAATELLFELGDADIAILINNAGSTVCGPFVQTSLDAHIKTIGLNITALTVLSKLVAVRMLKRGGGRILNVASTGAYQPGPYTAVYYASKAYVLSFTQALRRELAGSGVFVSALCPGATATEFSKRAGKRDLKYAMPARKVALCGYRGLKRGRAVIIPGIGNKIAVVFSKLLPGQVTAAAVAKIQKKLVL